MSRSVSVEIDRNATTALTQMIQSLGALLVDLRTMQHIFKDSPNLEEYMAWALSSMVNFGEEIASEASRLQDEQLQGKALRF